ncbi:MAG: DUF1080 domain-containing protein [Verrucomicrobiota bacterium]
MMKPLLSLAISFSLAVAAFAEEAKTITLFDGTSLEAFDFGEGAWEIAEDGSVTGNMEEVTDKKGEKKIRGMGYLWTKEEYGDFELTLEYKLSEAANSGVFLRAVKEDAIHRAHEIQIMDDEGWAKVKGEIEPRKRHGSFYEGKPASSNPAKAVGEWDTMTVRAVGPQITCSINGVEVFDVDLDDWPEVGKNPDGTPNKFKVAIKDKPRKGYIGFQNHGQVIWFRNIKVTPLD